MPEFEIEIAEGLEDITRAELFAVLDKRQISEVTSFRGAVTLSYTGDVQHLLRLRTASAVYRLLQYDVPRPKALLGHQNLHLMLDAIQEVLLISGKSAFQSFFVSAAGSDSSVMQRIKTELIQHLNLPLDDGGGDLLIRIRRTKTGWDVLIRLSPRPSATRDWRVCNMEGALNGPVAHALSLMTQPLPDDVFLNIMCGSGTILIERARFPARLLMGADLDISAIECARKNITSAGICAHLLMNDCQRLFLPDSSVDVICGDLPFGQLVGSHTKNRELYPAILRETARIAHEKTRCIFITHEIRLMEEILQQSPYWQARSVTKVTLRGLHPRIFILQKTAEALSS